MGQLSDGDRLPSSRALARELGVSRSVTEQAYDQLVAEGWLEARRGSGTYVSRHAMQVTERSFMRGRCRAGAGTCAAPPR